MVSVLWCPQDIQLMANWSQSQWNQQHSALPNVSHGISCYFVGHFEKYLINNKGIYLFECMDTQRNKKTMTKLVLNTGPADGLALVGARPSAGSVITIQAQGQWWPGSDLVKSQQRSLREKKTWLFYPTHQYSSWYFHSKDLLWIAFITKKQLLC